MPISIDGQKILLVIFSYQNIDMLSPPFLQPPSNINWELFVT